MTDQTPPARDRQLRGQCLCGAVCYRVADQFRYALNCHCSNCRRTTGSAFKPFAGIERGKLILTSGEKQILRYGGEGDAAHDVHCGQCGSLLYSVVSEGRIVHVALGSLVDEPTMRPTAHIFVGSKAPWYTICDDLPQHDEWAE